MNKDGRREYLPSESGLSEGLVPVQKNRGELFTETSRVKNVQDDISHNGEKKTAILDMALEAKRKFGEKVKLSIVRNSLQKNRREPWTAGRLFTTKA